MLQTLTYHALTLVLKSLDVLQCNKKDMFIGKPYAAEYYWALIVYAAFVSTGTVRDQLRRHQTALEACKHRYEMCSPVHLLKPSLDGHVLPSRKLQYPILLIYLFPILLRTQIWLIHSHLPSE